MGSFQLSRYYWGGTWNFPDWVMRNDWMSHEGEKKTVLLIGAIIGPLQWIQSSFILHFFLNSTTISWSLRQGNYPHFKEGGNWGTWGGVHVYLRKSRLEGLLGCVSLFMREALMSVLFPLFFLLLPSKPPAPLLFRSEIYSHLKISYSIVLYECIFGVCWMNVRWVSMKSYVDDST